jgi:hypothetical protein
MRCNRGSAHFEMIIAFVFFAGFTFSLFMFLSPQDDRVLSGAALSGFYDSFKEETAVNFSEIFLKVNTSGRDNCFIINLDRNNFKHDLSSSESIVENLGHTPISSQMDVSGSDVSFRIKQPGHSIEFFRFFISSEFTRETFAETCDDYGDFEIGSIVEKSVVSNSSLADMRNKYYSNYDELKKDLNIPFVFDFSIVMENLTEFNMKPESGIPSDVDVLAREYVFEILDSDGGLINEKISFILWR